MGLFKTEKVHDNLLGDMEVSFDNHSKKFTLSKTDRFLGTDKVYVYVDTADKIITDRQREIYQSVKVNFKKLIESAFHYLTIDKKYLNDSSHYKTESITIYDPVDNSPENWQLNLINVKDGFSHILVEFDNDNPFDFSAQA
jgi:hypothetical protein